MRYGKCSSLRICVEYSTTHYDFLEASFPSNFIMVGSTFEESMEMLLNNTCNVVATDRSNRLNLSTRDGSSGMKFIVGNKLMTKEPLAIVTRNNDREFSDITNWVVHALYYGEEQGLMKNSSLCQNYPALTSHHVSDLNFMNAVYCVGNYGEIIFDVEKKNRGMNQINNGTTGMVYATPFGKIEDDGLGDYDVTAGTILDGV